MDHRPPFRGDKRVFERGGTGRYETAARVVYLGAGERLKPTAKPNAIRQAIKTVLDDPAHRRAAQLLAADIRSDVQANRAVAEMEQLAMLTSPSRPSGVGLDD